MKIKSIKKTKILLLLAITMLASSLLTACGETESGIKKYNTLDDLKNCRFAISDSNTSYENDIEKEITGAQFDRYTNYFDTFIAVISGNADTAFAFKYTFIGLKETFSELSYIESNIKIPIVANFSKEANALKEDFNEFIKEAEKAGVIDKLAKKWMYEYDKLTDADIVDFSDLKGENGSFKFAVSDDNIPYEYQRNGELTGFEPALIYEFCSARGYKPEIIESQYNAVLAGVASGKYDMGMGGYGYTDERDENSNFSDPYFYDCIAYTVNGAAGQTGFFDNIKESFQRVFVTQNRWKLLIDGMLVTLFVTVVSILVGSIVGFALFMLSRRYKWLERLSYRINDTLEALPVLVVLMVFFYIIFGKTNISGVIVSMIVFALYFAFSFFVLICNSVEGVPREQTEAGLALGYNNSQTLFRVVLPQAMESFIPSIRSSMVATLKSTAIVGYVAVQDLTKAGDLIRSQTFEAFLPIIAIALLYFLLAKILIFLLSRILTTPSERRRKNKEGK